MTLRLRDLDPHAVALDACTALLDHVNSACVALSPLGEVRTPLFCSALEGCELYFSTRRLAAYAVDGGGCDAPVRECLVSLLPLYSAALGGGATDVDDLVQSEPTTALGVVIAAAVARETLAQGRPVTPAQLATLACVDRDYLLRLAAAGELPGARQAKTGRKPWTVTAKGATQWLAGRG